MKLTLIQFKSRDINQYEDTFTHILQLVESCCQTDTDLILLPECAYPGYFIGMSRDDTWADRLSELKQRLSLLAKSSRKYIAAGLADREGKKFYNRLLVYDRDGRRICIADKSNLWHFDSSWFEAGTEFPVFDTEFGRIGCMICADGRIPEIARCLRLQGAGLILDSANLVSAAPVKDQLTNQQYTFILRQRARENGVYIAVCNKCGIEDCSVTMLGRSMVIGPDGRILAECGPESEEILTCEINLDKISEYAQVLSLRQPEYYHILTAPAEALPVYQRRSQSCPLSLLESYTGFVRYSFQTPEEYVKKALHYMNLCRKANCRLVLLPYAKGLDLSMWIESLNQLADEHLTAVIGYGVQQAAILYEHTCELFTKTPLTKRTVEIHPGLTVSLVFDQEAEVPENIRVCMLQGADLVIWYDHLPSADLQQLMQTRATENRLFMARLTTSGEQDRTFACNPDGAILTTTFFCEEQVVFGMVYTALSRFKTIVPGTDLITSRIPEAYTLLIK